MAKKERRIVSVGLALLVLFTFTDLQISMAVAKKPLWARVLEVVGEIPFTTLTIAGCAMLFREMTDPIHEFTRWYQIVQRCSLRSAMCWAFLRTMFSSAHNAQKTN